MASVQSNSYDGRYLKLTVVEESTSITTNTSTVRWTIESIGGTDAYYTIYNCSVVVNGQTVANYGTKYWDSYQFPAKKGSETGTITVAHNNDGTASDISFTLNGRVYRSGTESHSGTLSLSTIPRFANVETWAVASRTEDSITLNWKTTQTCSAIRYGTNTSSYSTINNLNTNTGSVTITGLTAGQSYNLYFMPQRKDSSLWGDGSQNTWKSISEKTYGYPCLDDNGGPDFNIESPVSLRIFNPMGRECTIEVYTSSDTLIGTTTTTSTTAGPFLDDSTSYNIMYNSIPNSKEANYKVKVITSYSNTTKTGGKYKTDSSLCGPLFDDFTLADVDEDTRALTGNNSKQIVGYSDMAAIIHYEEKAESRKGATMAKYQFSIGDGQPYDIEYSYTQDVSETIDNAPSGVFKVYAIDSRGNSTLVQKQPTEVINYSVIQRGEISVSRQDNVGESTTLNFNGTFWANNFGAVNNSITNVRYRYKKTTDSDWPATWNGTTSILPTEVGNNYSFTGLIKGDTNTGFDAGNSYNIEVEVSDELSSIVFSTTLGSGVPNIALVEGKGVAINNKYDELLSDGLQITGKIYQNGTELKVPILDTSVSTSSTNGIENQAITNYVNGKVSNSSGTATNIAYSQSYINNALKWKLVQEVSGQTVITLPSSWNEIIIVSWMNNDIWKGMTITIPYGSPSGINYRLSYYGNDNDNANVGYYYNNNQVNLGWYNLNGGSSATLSQCKTRIYYR